MTPQLIIFLLLGGIIFSLLILSIVLFVIFYRTNKRINVLLEKGKIKDFKDVIFSQKERMEKMDERIKDIYLKIKELKDVSEITIQKTSFLRYNPFNDLGGNQSFVIALLDNKNNGFIISSLFSKEGNRVYSKMIKGGKAEQALSKEESDTLKGAINSK